MKQTMIAIIVLLIVVQCSTTFAVNYGDVYEVGNTYWLEQHNATVGKMIIRDGLGGTHFTWTKSTEQDERHVNYSFCDDDAGDIGDQLAEYEDTAVDQADRPGFASIDLYPYGDEMLATCFYHASMNAVMAVDYERGMGAFTEEMFQLQDRMSLPMIIKGTIDRNQNAHIVASSSQMPPDIISFGLTIWHGNSNGDPFDWNRSIGYDIENTTGLSHRIQASRTSDHVALAWHHNLVGVPAPERWENSAAHGLNNDLYLIESPDGEDWELDEPFNITRTIPADNEREGLLVYGDTLRPYNDVDLVYVGDVVHAVFTTRGFLPDPRGVGDPPVIDWTTEESFIWHWDSESDTLTLVADGWYENEGILSNLNLNSNVDRPSLAVDEDGNLYCIFRQLTDEDVDDNNFCMGEIMLALSDDDGETWSEAINLTGTIYNDDDRESDFINENYASIAEMVDDFLHIFYLQVNADHNGAVEYPMVYQRIAVEDLPEVGVLEMPREDFTYHSFELNSVEGELVNGQPNYFGINGIYPNPFNAMARVEYTLPVQARIRISLHDLNGREIVMLTEGTKEAGRHSLTIDSSDLTAGVYLTRLEMNDAISMAKVVIVK
ncbi:MAG: T9SS type A sorting domain-containing protein [Calditrichaeota bacterium]|nr:T9SS type A sorting domain-containing protein [Calditrichota bacterium]